METPDYIVGPTKAFLQDPLPLNLPEIHIFPEAKPSTAALVGLAV